MMWLPKFYIEELGRDGAAGLGLPTYNNARWKALAVEWLNSGKVLYVWRIDNEDDDNDSGLLRATGKCCC